MGRKRKAAAATAEGDEHALAFLPPRPQGPFIPPHMFPRRINGMGLPLPALSSASAPGTLNISPAPVPPPELPGFQHSESFNLGYFYSGRNVYQQPHQFQIQNYLRLPPAPALINHQSSGSLPTHYMGPYGPPHFMPAPSSQDAVYPQMAPASLSDIEKLRKLKETILCGQHPLFTAAPNPDALAKLYLGPHPLSQIFQDLALTDQQQIVSKDLLENIITLPTFLKPASTDNKLPSESSVPALAAPPDVSKPVSSATPLPQVAQTVFLDRNTQDAFQPTTQKGSEASLVADSQKDASSHVSSPTQAQAPPQPQPQPQPQAMSIQADSMSVDKPPPATLTQNSNGSHVSFKDSHLASSSRDYENERDRDRPGYPASEHARQRSDSFKFSGSQHFDRRDYGRQTNSRYSDWKFDKDHRDRDWDRDREREQERERDREKGRPGERYGYERLPPKFSGIERRASVSSSSFSATNIERRRTPEIAEDRGLRSQVPPHPEQRPVRNDAISRLDQRSGSEVSSHPEPRRGDLQPPSGPRRASLASQRPDQRPEALSHPEQRRGEHEHGAETKRAPYTLPQHNGRRAPLPYTDLHPPHSDLGSLDAEIARPPSRQPQPLHPHPEPIRPSASVSDQRPAPPRAPEAQFQKPFTVEPIPRHYAETALRDSYHRDQSSVSTTQTTTERIDKHVSSAINASSTETRSPLSVFPDTRATNLDSKPPTIDGHQRPGPMASHHMPPERNITQPALASRLSSDRRAGEPPTLDTRPQSVFESVMNDRDGLAKYYLKRSPSPHHRSMESMTDTTSIQRSTPMSSYREGPPQSRGYQDDRRASDTGPRRPPLPQQHYPPPADSAPLYHSQSIGERREIDRREESRQWRDRSENYPPPFGSQAEPERGGRRFSDTRGLSRGRPPPPPPPPPSGGLASWDRDKDKDKEYVPQSWMKYPLRGPSPPPRTGSIPPRWETSLPPPMHSQPPAHRPLQARLGDTYDQRFIPRDAMDRDRSARPPPPPPPPADLPMRDAYRSDNPRLRPRSPSPMARPIQGGGSYDDGPPRPAKRAREEYDIPPPSPLHARPGSYYDEGRRGSEADPYNHRMPPPPPPPSYYDHRPGPGMNAREPPPYARDRVSDQYSRRDAPQPPRSPPFYPPRNRYVSH